MGGANTHGEGVAVCDLHRLPHIQAQQLPCDDVWQGCITVLHDLQQGQPIYLHCLKGCLLDSRLLEDVCCCAHFGDALLLLLVDQVKGVATLRN